MQELNKTASTLTKLYAHSLDTLTTLMQNTLLIQKHEPSAPLRRSVATMTSNHQHEENASPST